MYHYDSKSCLLDSEEQTPKGLLAHVVQLDYIMDPGVFVSCKLFIDDSCCHNKMIISALTVDGWTALNLQLWVSDRSHYGTDRDPLLWTETLVLGEWRTLTLSTFVLIKQIVQKFHQVRVSLCFSWFIVKLNDTEKIGFINSKKQNMYNLKKTLLLLLLFFMCYCIVLSFYLLQLSLS